MADDHVSHLPRPFYDQWSARLRPAAHALWNWHSALAEPEPVGINGTGEATDQFFEEERERAEAGDPMRLLPEDVWKGAYKACEEHGLDRTLLAAQVTAARVLCGKTQFETADALKDFVGLWAVPHGRLLAGLAGLDMSVHLRYADELARGFFHLGRLLALPRDVAHGTLFIPLDTLRRKDVTVEQLREGRVDENVRGVLWKESVRVRDALAQGQPLIANLSLRQRFALKRFWVGGLELLRELERRDYDLWTDPLDLSVFRRAQVYMQILLGRSVSR
ncbi:MAG: phytoene synthase [Bacteroidetes bacterium QH_2_63_10]|nr:MAG: phytoene synthase [Bacteroidetes bacterium QH_2_63_10]